MRYFVEIKGTLLVEAGSPEEASAKALEGFAARRKEVLGVRAQQAQTLAPDNAGHRMRTVMDR